MNTKHLIIGLLAKTAILITEYAVERHKSGISFVEAVQATVQTHLNFPLLTIIK